MLLLNVLWLSELCCSLHISPLKEQPLGDFLWYWWTALLRKSRNCAIIIWNGKFSRKQPEGKGDSLQVSEWSWGGMVEREGWGAPRARFWWLCHFTGWVTTGVWRCFSESSLSYLYSGNHTGSWWEIWRYIMPNTAQSTPLMLCKYTVAIIIKSTVS